MCDVTPRGLTALMSSPFAPFQSQPEQVLKRVMTSTSRKPSAHKSREPSATMTDVPKSKRPQVNKNELIEQLSKAQLTIAERDTEIRLLKQRVDELKHDNSRLNGQIAAQLELVNHERKEAQTKHIDTLERTQTHIASLLGSAIQQQTSTVDNVLQACSKFIPRIMPPKPSHEEIVQTVHQRRLKYMNQTGQTVTKEMFDNELAAVEKEAFRQYQTKVKESMSQHLNNTITSREQGQQRLNELDLTIAQGQKQVDEASEAVRQSEKSQNDPLSVKALEEKLSNAKHQLQLLQEQRGILVAGLDKIQ